jgi:hypothetical protein
VKDQDWARSVADAFVAEDALDYLRGFVAGVKLTAQNGERRGQVGQREALEESDAPSAEEKDSNHTEAPERSWHSQINAPGIPFVFHSHPAATGWGRWGSAQNWRGGQWHDHHAADGTRRSHQHRERKPVEQRRGSVFRCGNCGEWLSQHCKVHAIPCCPGKCTGEGEMPRLPYWPAQVSNDIEVSARHLVDRGPTDWRPTLGGHVVVLASEVFDDLRRATHPNIDEARSATRLRHQVDELARVILRNYPDQIGVGDPVHGESAVAVATRILSDEPPSTDDSRPKRDLLADVLMAASAWRRAVGQSDEALDHAAAHLMKALAAFEDGGES